MVIFLLILIIIELAFISSLFVISIVLPQQEKKRLEELRKMREEWEKATK